MHKVVEGRLTDPPYEQHTRSGLVDDMLADFFPREFFLQAPAIRADTATISARG
jgi:hypothetical protein